ncbi:MAG TPA: MraY family glycosyltransferase [Polyangia bacterium]|nr:MraY family glycosyltransferase [Polyangia bacterium]
MRTAAVAFILSMLCGTFLTPWVRRLAHHFGVLDHARSSRKIHGQPIPRLGGIAIVISFYVPLVGLLLFHRGVSMFFLAERDHVIGLFVGGISIALLGLYDDLKGANAPKKFLVQFLVAALLYHLGFRFDVIANPFGHPIVLGWLSLPLTLLWVAGVINAMNLIDGLDGLAGGVALVAVLTTFLVSLQRWHPLMMLFSAALAGSIVGFLFYNFNPASIFMGDTGSMFLGFVLAATAMQTNQKASTAVALVIPAIALGLPIMDTLLAMARRALRGRPLFQPDKEHIHHKLMARGLSHRQAVLVLYGLCILLGSVALILTYANSGQTALLLLVLAAVAIAFLRSLGYVRLDLMPQTAMYRKRNRAVRSALQPLGRRLRQLRNANEMWPVIVEAAGILGAVSVTLLADQPAGTASPGGLPTPQTFTQQPPAGDEGTASLFQARFVIPGAKDGSRTLELGWADGRREIDRDTEIAAEIFCERLGEALDLVQRSTSLASVPASKAAPPS